MTQLTVVILATDGAATAAALESLSGQAAGAQVIVVGDLAGNPDLAKAVSEGDATGIQAPTDGPLGAWRNTGLAKAEGEFVVVLDPGERVARDSLDRHLDTLSADPGLVASYGRTAIQQTGRLRLRPEQGRSGTITRRLLKHKHLISSSACLLWRRAALNGPFPELQTPAALRLDLGLRLSRAGNFVFHPTVVAERDSEEVQLSGLEELVKVLIGVLYSGEPLDEKIELRARFRLARHLVAMGKLHYRAEDYTRASKFFDEAVKAAPGYFKGRRYQFLNFVKNTLTRTKGQ
jgi:glycosyltransferase involved in cell wall biosynthesis